MAGLKSQRFLMPRSIALISLLGTIALVAFSSFLPIDRPASAGQGKGGQIIAKPSPSPAKKPQLSPRNPAPGTRPVPRHKSLPAKFTNQYQMEFVLIPSGKFMMG